MEKNSVKCLITGAAGYLGTILVKTLYDMGYDIVSLVLPADNTEYISKYSQICYGDVCDEKAMSDLITDFDYVVHLAGIINIGSRNINHMRKVNVEGVRNIAGLCAERGIKMLYCSSVHAIPVLSDNQAMDEISNFSPGFVKGAYSKTKAEATKLVLDMANEGLDAMIAFPSGIIGPNEYQLSNIGQLITDFLCGGLKAYIDGKYNFVDVRDVADGICAMLENWHGGECYILSGHEVTVEEMLSTIAKASGQKMLRVKIPYWFVMGTSFLAEAYYVILR